jgi:hypothetical protein
MNYSLVNEIRITQAYQDIERGKSKKKLGQ